MMPCSDRLPATACRCCSRASSPTRQTMTAGEKLVAWSAEGCLQAQLPCYQLHTAQPLWEACCGMQPLSPCLLCLLLGSLSEASSDLATRHCAASGQPCTWPHCLNTASCNVAGRPCTWRQSRGTWKSSRCWPTQCSRPLGPLYPLLTLPRTLPCLRPAPGLRTRLWTCSSCWAPSECCLDVLCESQSPGCPTPQADCTVQAESEAPGYILRRLWGC